MGRVIPGISLILNPNNGISRDRMSVQNCTDPGYGVLKRLSSVCESAHSDNDDEILQYATIVPFPSGNVA